MPPTTLHALKPFLARAEKGNPSFEVVPISHSLSSIPDLTVEKTKEAAPAEICRAAVVAVVDRVFVENEVRRTTRRRDARQRRKLAGGEVILKLP